MRGPELGPPQLEIAPSMGDIVAIGVAAFLAVLAIVLLWWYLAPKLRRFVQWIDNVIPVNLSEFGKTASRAITALLSLMVLGGAGLSIAGTLGVDTSTILAELEEFGTEVKNTAVPPALRVFLILFIAWLATRLLRHVTPPLVRRFLARRTDAPEQEEETQKRTRTLEGVIWGTFNAVIVTIAFLVILTELGINVAPILAGAGIVGIAVGFGAQTLIRDLIGGFFIIMEDQYRVGDVARIGGVAGLVEEINLRRTILRDLDFIVHVIPNGEVRIASNFTKEKSRVNLNIEVAYKEDMDHVIAVLNQVGEELSRDPYYGPLINQPLQVLRVDEFRDSGIAIKVLGETQPIRQWEVAGEYRKRVKKAFDNEGIEIPFPHLTIYWGSGVETPVKEAGHGNAGEGAGPASRETGTGSP